ncbi:MAG: M1 family aminopeptidase, partial [Bacteroidetes bacterium]|nr:M1 family aminopeptidase [Bacteroidota bacterium]
MEHQSAVTYGNKFKNGYLGRDLSGSGWGLKWDFIIVHESGHEWFGNNITSKDIADMWIHEGFTSFSETLYTDWVSGKQAGNEYNFGIRRNIRNTSPIIGAYGVNGKGGDDMYYKTSNMLQTIRNAMNDDAKFRLLLRNLNANFYHQTVTALDIQNSMSTDAGFDLSKIFEQYLKGIQIPVLELSVSNDSKKISYRWTNCVDGFNLPIYVTTATGQKKLLPKSNEVSTIDLAPGEASFFNAKAIEFNYFIKVKEVKTAQ